MLKNPGKPLPLSVRQKKKGLGKLPENFFDHTLFTLGIRISYVNEKVKMKESMQSDREMRIQDDNIIKENANARSSLAFRDLTSVVAYMQSQKTQRELERRSV